jgi:hypothetical protein
VGRAVDIHHCLPGAASGALTVFLFGHLIDVSLTVPELLVRRMIGWLTVREEGKWAKGLRSFRTS